MNVETVPKTIFPTANRKFQMSSCLTCKGLECKSACAALTQVTLATACSQWDTMQQVRVHNRSQVWSHGPPNTLTFLTFLRCPSSPASFLLLPHPLQTVEVPAYKSMLWEIYDMWSCMPHATWRLARVVICKIKSPPMIFLVAGLVVCFFPNVERFLFVLFSILLWILLYHWNFTTFMKRLELTDFVQDCSLPLWTLPHSQLDDMLFCASCRTFTPSLSTFFIFVYGFV